MAAVHLPPTLPPLFPELPRRLDSGLPQRDAFLGVLREGMAIDDLDTPGLYFGTSTGQVFASADEGDTWNEIASYLPGIASVEVAVLER